MTWLLLSKRREERRELARARAGLLAVGSVAGTTMPLALLAPPHVAPGHATRHGQGRARQSRKGRADGALEKASAP